MTQLGVQCDSAGAPLGSVVHSGVSWGLLGLIEA